MAPIYALPRLLARNKLTLQDFDFYEIHEAFASTVLTTLAAWEDDAFCKQYLGLDSALGLDRPREAQRQRFVAGGRPPVRRNRRTDRRHARQDAARERRRARADLDLRGRRPGCRRDSGRNPRMSDRYLNLVNSPVGAKVASTVGLPRPAVLRRYRPGDPLVPGPVLVGSTAGKVPAALTKIVDRRGRGGRDRGRRGRQLGALILDARSVTTPVRPRAPARVPRRRSALAAAVRTGPRARSRRPTAPTSPSTPTRQALDGIVRSLAKELQRGSTANLLWVEDEASLASALRFFLSGRSAYVDGQPVLLGAGAAPAPKDWDQPLAGKTALVTGAARGIGAAIAGVLARDGAHVIVADLPQAGETLAKVANRVGGTTLHLDVAAADAPQKLLAHLAAQTAGLDILVHNAGITRDKLLANMKPEQWDSVHRGEPRVAAADQRGPARQRPAQRPGPRGLPVVDDRPVRQPRPDELRRDQGRRDRPGPRRRPPRSPRTATRRSTRSRPASSTPR